MSEKISPRSILLLLSTELARKLVHHNIIKTLRNPNKLHSTTSMNNKLNFDLLKYLAHDLGLSPQSTNFSTAKITVTI